MTLLGELLKNARVGGGPCGSALQNRQLQLVEENLAQLKIRVDVELHSCDLVDLALDGLSLHCESRLERAKPLEIDRHPLPLHPREHIDERHLDLAKESSETIRLELRGKMLAQLKGHVRFLARIVARAIDRAFIEGDGRLAAPAQLLKGRHPVIEELECEDIETK